jgi:diguanylate cyclase (GGDEF)-like protein
MCAVSARGSGARRWGAMTSVERNLCDVLGEFARTMATEFPIQSILDHLVDRIVQMLPIDAAGVTLFSPGVSPHYVAASDDSARRFESLQTELNEGPCLLAGRLDAPILVPDLYTDERFPSFGPRALAAGLVAVFTFPLRHGSQQLGALDLYRASAGPLSVEATTAAQTLADVAAAYLINASTREELRLALARTRREALHDGLTGLPNRQLLMDRLEHAFARSRRSGLTSAVLFMDLDGLKPVNDSFGHAVGDQLLVAVADRLLTLVRPSDTLARLSGDEFVLICENLEDQQRALAIGNRLVSALARPYNLNDVQVHVSASIGVACAGPGAHSASQLLHQADTAMYQAKRLGGGRQQLFNPDQQHLAAPTTSLEQDLAAALPRGELRNEYQPIVSTADSRLMGFEALVRWTHPERGEITPDELIPLAERSDLIGTIGHWTLGQALTDRRLWQRPGSVSELPVWVNVSAHQIMSDSFLPQVRDMLAAHPGPPELLTLEVTESVFLRDGDRAVTALTALRDLGVRLALDDFGSGYSSMNYLKRFPVDIVKLDQSFIADLGVNRVGDSIVEAMVQLAHKLGLTVVAEGVETEAQRSAVARLGCDLSQGFYYAHPMPSARTATLVSRGTLIPSRRIPGNDHVPAPRTAPEHAGRCPLT